MSATTARSVELADLIAHVRALVGQGAAAAIRLDEALIDAAMCAARRISPAQAEPQHVAVWIRALAGLDPSDVKPRAMATIERYLVHVGWAYLMVGLADPTAGPLVKFERKAPRNHLGVRQREARAIRFKGDIADLDSPAAGVCLASLLKGCGRDKHGLRDAALPSIAYDTGMRRSELVAIEVVHIDGPDAEEAGVVHIPASKSDRAGAGVEAYLAPVTMAAAAPDRAPL